LQLPFPIFASPILLWGLLMGGYMFRSATRKAATIVTF
jgi:hypothetical protein